MNLNFTWSPTISKFLKSTVKVCFLIGPTGEGKTFGWIGKMYLWAELHRQWGARLPIRVAIIRDTHENIKKHTVQSINKMIGGIVRFHDDYRKMVIPGMVDCDLFGANNLTVLGKLQASEYHLKIIEEPAPIVMVGNAGVPEEFFTTCYARGPREPKAKSQVIVSMNPSDETHWTYHLSIEDPLLDTEVFRVERGENKFLSEEERENVRQAYAHRPDLLARYDRGEFSFVATGEAVTPEYNEKFHRSEVKLDPIKKVRAFRFWDGGLYPSCVIGQLTPRGKFMVLDTLRGENMGIKQFIQTQVRPLLDERYKEIVNWRDLGDPALDEREQSDSSVTAAGIINGELNASFEGGESGWQARKEALKELLNRMVDGEPMFLVSKHEGILHRGLRGGWHYHKDNSGNILRDKPVKDIHSHPCDALSHGIARIFGYKQKPFTKIVSRQVGRTYAVPSLYGERKHA